MFRKVLPLAVLFVLSLSVSETMAQRRVPNRRPSISPFVNLFNNNTGGVSNYFQFVRPLQQQQRINQQQFNQTNRLQRQLAQPQINQQLNTTGFPSNVMLRPGNQGVGTPSQAATFLNYSHFYATPGAQAAVGNRRTPQF